MDEWLWSWLQPHGTFVFRHIGWYLLTGWLVLWLLFWRLTPILTTRWQQSRGDWLRGARLWLMPFPITYRLLATRLNYRQLSGLPLTLAIITLLSLLLLLAGVVEQVVEREFITQMDLWVADAMAHARTEPFISIFHHITLLGNAYLVLPLLTVTLLTLTLWKNPFWVLPLLVSVAGSMSMAGLGKYGFARPRPITSLFVEHSPAFPSAHATLAMAFYAVIFYLWWRQVTHWNTQVSIAFIGSSFVLLLASSRIIIGVHYVSDVMAGLLLGGLWFVIAISLYEWLNAKQYIQLRARP